MPEVKFDSVHDADVINFRFAACHDVLGKHWKNFWRKYGMCLVWFFFFRFLFPLAYPSQRLRSIQDTEQNVQTIMTNCCRQNCTFFFWIGNRITNWRAWGNQNGSAKIVSEILCNKSSNLWSGWTEIFAPIFTRIPKYSKSRATVWSSYACCNAKLLLEKSAQVRVGQASNADCIFSFTLLMVPCNHSNPQLPNH